MKIYIIEGIATSGKSSLIAEMLKVLPGSIAVYGEDQTHEPIMEQRDAVHLDFFLELVQTAVKSGAEYVVFDRLYLTQAIRANLQLSEYAEVERVLHEQAAEIIFLTVEETTIQSRIERAIAHRPTSWGEYASTRGKTPQEVVEYYRAQQRQALELLQTSLLRHRVIDTTAHKYQAIVKQLLTDN